MIFFLFFLLAICSVGATLQRYRFGNAWSAAFALLACEAGAAVFAMRLVDMCYPDIQRLLVALSLCSWEKSYDAADDVVLWMPVGLLGALSFAALASPFLCRRRAVSLAE